MEQRGELVDVRAQHDHVSRFEGLVVGERVVDRISCHLDLPGTSMAGMDLDRPVAIREAHALVGGAGRRRRPGRVDVGPDVGLDAMKEGRWVVRSPEGVRRVDCIGRRRQHELHLTRVGGPGAEQGVGGHRRRGVVDPEERQGRRRTFGDTVPEDERGMEREQMDVALAGERPQDVEVRRRQPRQTEQRDPFGKIERDPTASQPGTGTGDPLRRAR